MDNVLILCNPMFDKMDFDLDMTVDCVCTYRNIGIITKIIRNNKYLIRLSLANWIQRLSTYSHIIIFDSSYKPGLMLEIRKRNLHARIFFYFRNRICSLIKFNLTEFFEETSMCDVDIWSYSRIDCEQYGLRYNGQFVNNHMLEENEETYDIIFVGNDKGRSSLLGYVYNECERKNLRSFFYITGKNKEKYNRNITDKYLPYESYIKKYASRSKALLDIVTEGNYGLTLRPLEAMFLKKKIITNYLDIKYEKFYNPSNIFIIGEDDFEEIESFLNAPEENVAEDIKNCYTCENWIMTFINDNP